jgi:putative lipoic acid-binding regulatory protein
VSADAGNDDEARSRALALLEATHQFPCAYSITVIAFNAEAITTALRSEARATWTLAAESGSADSEPDRDGGPAGGVLHQTRASREGKYLSHQFSVPVRAAGDVLELYARLRAIEGVVTIL